MRVYSTGHEIADTVALSLTKGFSQLADLDAAIGYGILRGMTEKLRSHDHWFLVDRGYLNPGHFDGYYRISYKGTQARYDAAYPTQPSGIEFEPIRRYDKSKPVLVCPPTGAVCEFFKLEDWQANGVIRHKGDANPINWDDYSAVITFNSSVGWEAIRRGIPCLSDTTHSVVGSYYNTKSIDETIELFNTLPREPLFNFMRSHQFTLAEIEQGKAWGLVQSYLSAMTAGKQLPPMSLPIVFAEGLKHHFQSNT